MSTKMTLQKYVDYIYRQLGGPLVKIENKDELPQIINDSLEELKEYLTYNKFVTVPYSNRIDLSKYKIRSIIQIYRTAPAEGTNLPGGSTDAFLMAAGMISGMPYDLTSYMNIIQARKIKNTISTDLDYRWDDPYLYITQNVMQNAWITIEYTPEIESVEELDDDWWIGKFRRLALANAKINLGMLRGKYRLANSLYENDGKELLQRGLQEKDEIIRFLESNHDTILPI